MITLIRNPDGTLKTFAERGDDLSLAPGETLELSPLTFEQFAARLRLLVDGRGGETVRVPAGSPACHRRGALPGQRNGGDRRQRPDRERGAQQWARRNQCSPPKRRASSSSPPPTAPPTAPPANPSSPWR